MTHPLGPTTRRVFRWTARPRWYVRRGWRVLAVKAGLGYVSVLVAR